MPLINTELSCCFVHVPKNAGTSIRHWFRDNNMELKIVGDEHDSMSPEYSSYYSFAVIRHPLDWIISMKSFIAQWSSHYDTVKANTYSLNEWIKYQSTLRHQSDYIVGVDDIFRYEHLQELQNKLSIMFGLHGTIPCVNQSNHKHYLDYYSKQNIELVKKLFFDDYKYYD